VASKLGEYTLVDRGTWYSIEDDVTNELEIFVSSKQLQSSHNRSEPLKQAAGTDDEDDPLLNSAHALVGAFGVNKGMATEFVDWLIGPKGQQIIEIFSVKGHILYSPAPKQDETISGL
jgi:ABC-type tungstate transport system permease subunit